MIQDPMICLPCSEMVSTAYKFKLKCLETEEKLRMYAMNNGDVVNTTDYLTHTISIFVDQIDNAINDTLAVKDDIPYVVEPEFVDLKEYAENDNDRKDEQNVEKSTQRNKGKVIPKCKFCSKVFVREYALRKHMEKHPTHVDSKLYQCTYCAISFQSKYVLEEHLRIHTGERPYKCTTCGKAFAQRSTLCTHIKYVHTKEKPHVCEICGKAFPVRGGLTSHQKCMHSTDEKSFVCDVCGKIYRRKKLLDLHKKWH